MSVVGKVRIGNKMNREPGNHSALQKGLRLNLAIRLNSINEDGLCKKSQISYQELESIHRGEQDLNRNQAQKIAEAFMEQGFVCAVDWLMEGRGLPPYFSKDAERLEMEAFADVEDQMEDLIEKEIKVLKEIKTFKELYSEGEVRFAEGDGMAPLIRCGDYLGGVKVQSHKMESALNHICMVTTLDGRSLVRYVALGSAPKTYTLSCLNPDTTEPNAVLRDVEVASVAPIVWIRFPNVYRAEAHARL